MSPDGLALKTAAVYVAPMYVCVYPSSCSLGHPRGHCLVAWGEGCGGGGVGCLGELYGANAKLYVLLWVGLRPPAARATLPIKFTHLPSANVCWGRGGQSGFHDGHPSWVSRSILFQVVGFAPPDVLAAVSVSQPLLYLWVRAHS
jgi:hypothetical protein